MTSRAKNAGYTKEYNRLQILRLLRQQPVSRAELARLTGLTRAAISLIVEELIEEGMVKESAQSADAHTRGRTPVLLKLHPEGAYALGVRLTRKDYAIGLCNFRGHVVASRQQPLPKGPQQLVEHLADDAQMLLQENGVPRSKLLGVGVSAPGPVDAATGMLLNPPGFDAYHNFPLCSQLQQRLGLPILLENDANAAALYNYMDGQFAGKENFLLLMVDSGIGSGVIWNGRLLRGCELGHTSVDYRGPKCACGNWGCLETVASVPKILKAFPGYDSWEMLLESENGDNALKRQAEFLAAALVNFTNLLPVETILLAGQLHHCCARLAPMIQGALRGRTLSLGAEDIPILPALHTSDGALREACSVVIAQYLRIS